MKDGERTSRLVDRRRKWKIRGKDGWEKEGRVIRKEGKSEDSRMEKNM